MLLVVCQLSRDVIGYEGPATVLFRTTFTRTVILNLLMYRLRVYTNRTECVYLAYCKNRTLAVPSVRLYRLCSCNTVCAEATGSFHPTYQRAALERQCITEISGIFFHFFKIYRCVVLFFPFQYAYFWLYSWVVSMSVSTNGIELINVILFFNVESVVPSIAQLVERRTVEWIKSSLGRWFESGSKELIFLLFPARLTILYLLSEALIDFEKFWFCFFIVIILWCMINYQNVRVGSY